MYPVAGKCKVRGQVGQITQIGENPRQATIAFVPESVFGEANNYLVGMNFLAHAFLSENHDKIMVGNFIADFVKGKNALAVFEDDIKTGIELHRSIDFYTDNHDVVSASKQRLRAKYRHYAGVIVDVFYDHYLAREWARYSEVPLPEFAQHTYDLLMNYDAILPGEVRQVLPYMIRGNWLVNYGTTEGISRALSGMSRRTPYESKMDEAVSDLLKYYEDFRTEFNTFFPQLHEHAKKFLQQKGFTVG